MALADEDWAPTSTSLAVPVGVGSAADPLLLLVMCLCRSIEGGLLGPSQMGKEPDLSAFLEVTATQKDCRVFSRILASLEPSFPCCPPRSWGFPSQAKSSAPWAPLGEPGLVLHLPAAKGHSLHCKVIKWNSL